MNVDLVLATPLILSLITGTQRKGKRPTWARRTDVIAVPSAILLILTGWVFVALHGTIGEWVIRLAYLPMAVMACTSWVRDKSTLSGRSQ